ncbi:MAG: J domain-containing protein [Deltaproteobacteria bacterium]|nr:J domain-containing protein [Deltaproteobacteria bacterium]
MEPKNTYEKINWARTVLELPESATMGEIKEQQRKLVMKWHPDTCQEKKEFSEEMTGKINEAYKIIMTYCNNYAYSFSKEEIGKYLTDEEWWFKRFGGDPLWGNAGANKES